MIYRFGVFEADTANEELRRKGMRVRLHAQPFRILQMLVERQGEVVSREEISLALWPDGTFVDFEQGVNSAVNRLREALGDKAANPMFVETVARKGYRFLAPVEVDGTFAPTAVEQVNSGFLDRVLATQEDLPRSSHTLVKTLFLLLQGMYLGFYVGALANLAEIGELLAPVHVPVEAITVTAALLIPVRVFQGCAVLFRAPGFRAKYLKLWPFLLAVDAVWALAPLLLLHHINDGVALACMAVLVYSPFAQRSLMLMGVAGD